MLQNKNIRETTRVTGSRRQFLSTVAMMAGAGIALRPRLEWAADITDPRVADIVATDTKLTQPGGSPGSGRGSGGDRGRGGGGPGGGGPGGGRGPSQQGGRGGERTNQAWQDQTAGFYYVVVDAMIKTGFTPDEIGRIGGGNFLRIFGEAVKK